MERDNWTCYICGQAAMEVDHVNPGDNHNSENLKAICIYCHRKKSGREGGLKTRY
jgi:5-methylcytosine-specific restriction endonuclease McrA